MDNIEKLFSKISKEQKKYLLEIIERLLRNEKKRLDIKKIKNTDFYRLRAGRFRIIYHIDNKEIIIDAIKLRDERTYR